MTVTAETTNVPDILAEIADIGTQLIETQVDRPEALPDGTNPEKYGPLFDVSALTTEMALMTGTLTYTHVLAEAFFAVVSSDNDEDLRRALVGTAGLAVAWIDDIDKRS